MKNLLYVLTFLLLTSTALSGQEYSDDNWQEVVPQAIPSAPAFSLLGVNPETVTRPSDVKSFKVDWRIKNYNVAPDLAFEAQPIWWLHTRKKGPRAYREASPFARAMSTASVSLATAKIDNLNHLSYAVKFNVYKEHDPYLVGDIVDEKMYDLEEFNTPIDQQIDSLNLLYSRTSSPERKRSLEEELGALKSEKDLYTRAKMDEIADEASATVGDHWNMDMVDIAFGRVFTYNNAEVDSLNFSSAGFGIWVNAAKGMGDNSLLTGLIRLNRVGGNSDFMLGGSYRYGSRKYNFFTELVFNRIGNNPLNGFSEEELFGDKYTEDIGVGWYQFGEGESFSRWTLSYGGDFKLSRNILLNFSIRTELTGGFTFDRLLPVANLVCLMN